MRIIADNVEHKIIPRLLRLSKDSPGWKAIHIDISKIPQSRALNTPTAMNMLADLFQDIESEAYIGDSRSMFILLERVDDITLEELLFNLRSMLSAHGIPEACQVSELDKTMHGWLEYWKERLMRKQYGEMVSTAEEQKEDFAAIAHFAQDIAERRLKREQYHALIVEDDKFSQKMLAGLIRELYPMQVSMAENGRSGVELYVLKAPNIVFLDINLPDMNGLNVLKNILELDSEAFVVMLSGNSSFENVAAAAKAGSKGFIAKPFSKEKLQHYLTMSLETGRKGVHA